MDVEPIDSGDAPVAVGGYSQALRVRGAAELLFVSGQVPESQDGEVPAEFADQCRLAWANLLAQVAAAGMAVTDVVKVTTYLSDRRYAAENRAVRAEVLGGHRPALTVIITGIFDERWLLEIEAIAAR